MNLPSIIYAQINTVIGERMAIGRGFERIPMDKVKEIAKKKGLKPGMVKGTDTVQLTKGSTDRMGMISWDEFEEILNRKGLAVYEYGGYMKIFRIQ